MTEPKVNTRISFQGSVGTVRYCGQIPAWPGVLAYGVEWDDASRGRHSGTYNGVEYFRTRVPNSGSFVKQSGKFDRRVEFVDALRSRYAPEKEDELEKKDIAFGSKVALRVGFDKIRKLNAQLERLTYVSLERSCVAYASSGLDSICPSIEGLDLSNNLFDSLDEVAEIARQLPRLRELRLNGNRFVSWDVSDLRAFKGVREISLAGTLTPEDVLARAPGLFCGSVACNLAGNMLSGRKIEFRDRWGSLESLDLSFNEFSEIPELVLESSLTSLNLSHNSIASVSGRRYDITALDLRYNALASWKDVDAVSVCFPGLTGLRIQWNPVFADLPEDEVHLGITARVGTLEVLDGVRITSKERVNAELYFMGKVLRNEVEFDLDGPRWKELCELHGAPVAPAEQASRYVEIDFVKDGESTRRRVPRGTTTQKLKMLVRKWYKLPPSDIKLAVVAGSSTLELDDGIKPIEYYGVEDNCKITVRV